MDKSLRVERIRKIEQERHSRVLCYLTGDRPRLETKIGNDVYPFFYDVLHRMGTPEQIDLFLYSTGGVTVAAWGLVSLIREFCKRLCVLIPFRAHSTAALIALGADEILMTRMGQLSPVDPSVSSPFNPTVPVSQPGAPPQYLPVSVEDVRGFFDLAKEEAKIGSQENLADLLKILASDVRPLALGGVYRARQQINLLSQKLLRFHMKDTDKPKIEAIVNQMVRALYSHDYWIGRSEAKNDIGLEISELSQELEQDMIALFNLYVDAMELRKPYDPNSFLEGSPQKVGVFDRAFIESADCTYVFRTKREVKKLRPAKQDVPMDMVQERTLEEGWVLDK